MRQLVKVLVSIARALGGVSSTFAAPDPKGNPDVEGLDPQLSAVGSPPKLALQHGEGVVDGREHIIFAVKALTQFVNAGKDGLDANTAERKHPPLSEC